MTAIVIASLGFLVVFWSGLPAKDVVTDVSAADLTLAVKKGALSGASQHLVKF